MPSEQLSDWWPRARAFLLDQLIVAGAAIAVWLLAVTIAGDPSDQARRELLYTIAIAAGCLYAPLLMARPGARNGQTIGKQVVGIRVVRTDGAPVGVWLGALRTVFAQQLLTAITFYLYALVDYLWPLRDPQNQALHDKIAKTWVVRVPAAMEQTPETPPQASPSPFGDSPSPFGPPPTEPPLPLPEADETPVQGWLPPRPPGA